MAAFHIMNKSARKFFVVILSDIYGKKNEF